MASHAPEPGRLRFLQLSTSTLVKSETQRGVNKLQNFNPERSPEGQAVPRMGGKRILTWHKLGVRGGPLGLA